MHYSHTKHKHKKSKINTIGVHVWLDSSCQMYAQYKLKQVQTHKLTLRYNMVRRSYYI